MSDQNKGGEMDLEHKIEQTFVSVEKGHIYRAVIDDTEKVLIEKALSKTNGNQILAARILGLNRNTLRTKIRKLEINTDKFKM